MNPRETLMCAVFTRAVPGTRTPQVGTSNRRICALPPLKVMFSPRAASITALRARGRSTTNVTRNALNKAFSTKVWEPAAAKISRCTWVIPCAAVLSKPHRRFLIFSDFFFKCKSRCPEANSVCKYQRRSPSAPGFFRLFAGKRTRVVFSDPELFCEPPRHFFRVRTDCFESRCYFARSPAQLTSTRARMRRNLREKWEINLAQGRASVLVFQILNLEPSLRASGNS